MNAQIETLRTAAAAAEDRRRAEIERVREERIAQVQQIKAAAAQRENQKIFVAKHGIASTKKAFATLIRGEQVSSEFQAAMGSTNENGAFLIPSAVLDAAVVNSGEHGTARAHARLVTLPAGVSSIPVITRDVAIYNVNTQRQADVSLDDVIITQSNFGVQTFAVSAVATRELIDSAPDWGAAMIESIGVGIMKIEDSLVFRTTGATWAAGSAGLCEVLLQPSRAGSLVTMGAGATTTAAVTASKLREMIAKLATRAHANAKWFCHPAVMSEIFLRLHGPANAAGDMAERFPVTVSNGVTYFANFPVVPTSVMPSAPTAGQIALVLGDLQRGVTLGQRDTEEITLSQTNGEVFQKGHVMLRGLLRCGVGLVDVGSEAVAGSVIGLRLAAT